jgi:hypothetical protein
MTYIKSIITTAVLVAISVSGAISTFAQSTNPYRQLPSKTNPIIRAYDQCINNLPTDAQTLDELRTRFPDTIVTKQITNPEISRLKRIQDSQESKYENLRRDTRIKYYQSSLGQVNKILGTDYKGWSYTIEGSDKDGNLLFPEIRFYNSNNWKFNDKPVYILKKVSNKITDVIRQGMKNTNNALDKIAPSDYDEIQYSKNKKQLNKLINSQRYIEEKSKIQGNYTTTLDRESVNCKNSKPSPRKTTIQLPSQNPTNRNLK